MYCVIVLLISRLFQVISRGLAISDCSDLGDITPVLSIYRVKYSVCRRERESGRVNGSLGSYTTGDQFVKRAYIVFRWRFMLYMMIRLRVYLWKRPRVRLVYLANTFCHRIRDLMSVCIIIILVCIVSYDLPPRHLTLPSSYSSSLCNFSPTIPSHTSPLHTPYTRYNAFQQNSPTTTLLSTPVTSELKNV